ncbi:hypothetical protein [Actinacidiphila alni]|uniref:Uncharacterized protein n=1 Tax=Actinacidiphila alni TaxID=380248 RepID=A0A1I2J2V7_9ACTN|nr:hypothetical protein [Actinacidiphila alni]SFF49052.1 hypothetical protein SAMN05216251_11637 [Actinacidiphila alni]
MPAPNWPALGRSVARFCGDRLLRALIALGSTTVGVVSSDWWKSRGEHWWEGAAPAEGSGPRAVAAAARTPRGGLADPGVLRKLRALRGSQDLPRFGEPYDGHLDAAPCWHPERRAAGGS